MEKSVIVAFPDCAKPLSVCAQIVAAWLVSRWIAAGTSLPIRLIELGPGRGTLIEDVLRVSKSMKLRAHVLKARMY